ncbi:MAG: hypothetical protein MI802_04280 [Desulfobacterales bacterium]|nr:hypothetical protein [Desulfobacterales bacterium]
MNKKALITLSILLWLFPNPGVQSAEPELTFQKVQILGSYGNGVIVFRDGYYVQMIEGWGTNGTVDSIRSVRLNIAENPFVEAFQSTSRGNGCYALYESNHNGGLFCILAVRGVDSGDSGYRQFQGNRLQVEYTDVNNDGWDDIKLTGVIEYLSEGEENISKSVPCQRVFVWKQDEDATVSFSPNGQYREDLSLRLGYEEYDGLYDADVKESLLEE